MIATDTGLQQTGTPVGSCDNTVQGYPIHPLPSHHSITVNGVVCGGITATPLQRRPGPRVRDLAAGHGTAAARVRAAALT
jgi:hypothetical protein